MKKKIMAALKALLRSLSESAARSAQVQKEIESARTDFYRKHPEVLIRRGIL